jgi:hydrogenase nickel incorporation protein HypA/HybF
MHEVGIMQNALNLALKRASEHGAARIEKIRLRIGALSGVVPDALEFAFETLKQNTPAAQAQLVIEPVPAVCWCGPCQVEFESADLMFDCPHCGGLATELRRGRELDLVSVETA